MSETNNRLNAAAGVSSTSESRWRLLVKRVEEAPSLNGRQKPEEIQRTGQEPFAGSGRFRSMIAGERRGQGQEPRRQEAGEEEKTVTPAGNKWQSLVAKADAERAGSKMR